MLRGRDIDPQLAAVKYLIVPYTRGAGIELGRGPHKAYPHFIAVRERGDKAMPENVSADVWVDSFAQLEDSIEAGSLDFIFEWGEAWMDSEVALRLLKEGGHFVWSEHGQNGITVMRKVTDVTDGFVDVDTRVASEGVKTACVVRYGAIGDTLQAASILPELKRQGYHVTFMSEPLGAMLLANDPHIDEFYVQDKDQVPNHELPQYWAVQAKRFDKFINLCESVEGTLISLPGRALHRFPHDVRHELCNKNYLEFTARLAELPFHPEHHFYPTGDEVAKADALLNDIGNAVNPSWVIGERWVEPYVVMFSLSGSALHKFYPHQDAVIARILVEIPHAHVVLTGDAACKILEAGWGEGPRVHCLSGEQTIRETLALAQKCNLVIGPETGVLNSVAFEKCAKVLLLSHSSHENLSRDWFNTESVEPYSTECYPCHQLHTGHEFCPEHKETGSALCQWNITPDRVWAAVQRAFVGWGTVNNLMRAA